MATSIYLAGYSTTRGITPDITTLMGNYTVLEPAPPAWGLSSQFLANIVPVINAVAPEPGLLWVAVGGAWDMRRSPLAGSALEISVADYKTNMTNGLNSVLANTSIPYIIVANCVPIGAAQGIADPFRFEVDAVLYRTAILEVIASIGNSRIIFYDMNQMYLDRGIVQTDGIHADAGDNQFLVANVISSYFKTVLGDTMANQIVLNNDDLILAPYAWGQGNGNVNQNVGNFPTYKGLYQNCVLTNMDANNGYRYTDLNSRLIFDVTDPDYIETAYNRPFTNTNEFSIETWSLIGAINSNRNLCGARDGASDFWRFGLTAANKIQFTINIGGVTQNTLSTDTVSIALHHIVVVKRVDKFYFFVDGVEVVAYDTQPAYNYGNKTFADTMRVASYGASAITWKDNLYWFRIILNSALSNADILYNYGLGVGINGLIGTNTGDNMDLSYPVVTGGTVKQSHTSISIGIGIM